MEYFEKVAAYEDAIIDDIAENEFYDYEKTAATRFKELMNAGDLSTKAVGRLNQSGYLNPKIRPRARNTFNPNGLALDYKKGIFGKRKPIRTVSRYVNSEGIPVIAMSGRVANKGGDISMRMDKLKAAKRRNALMVTNRWGREMANANGGHLTPELAKQLREKSFNAFGSRGQL